MSYNKHKQQIKSCYEQAKNKDKDFAKDINADVSLLCNMAEHNRGVLSVLITCLLAKLTTPEVDIRRHQFGMGNKSFSGRSLDTKIVTPFLKSMKLPHMSESGWLTRSLEQPHPYDLKYPGKIKGKGVKESFLSILDLVEKGTLSPRKILIELFYALINKPKVKLEVISETISTREMNSCQVLNFCKEHINSSKDRGTSKLPVLLVYALVKCQIDEKTSKYKKSSLVPLKSHTASDLNSKSFGDIELLNSKQIVEAFEIKLNKIIDEDLVTDCALKINKTKISRYTILTTGLISPEARTLAEKLYLQTGVEFLLYNVFDYIEFSLLGLQNPNQVLEEYVSLVFKDQESVKDSHKKLINDLINKYQKMGYLVLNH